MDVKWIEKFSLPKLITLLVGIAITIGGFILTVTIFSKFANEEISSILLAYLGMFIVFLGIVTIVQSFLMKDKWFEVDGHTVRAYVGFANLIVQIDGQIAKRFVLITFSSKDLDNKVDGLKVRLHVNGWGATTIFVNGEKIY